MTGPRPHALPPTRRRRAVAIVAMLSLTLVWLTGVRDVQPRPQAEHGASATGPAAVTTVQTHMGLRPDARPLAKRLSAPQWTSGHAWATAAAAAALRYPSGLGVSTRGEPRDQVTAHAAGARSVRGPPARR